MNGPTDGWTIKLFPKLRIGRFKNEVCQTAASDVTASQLFFIPDTAVCTRAYLPDLPGFLGEALASDIKGHKGTQGDTSDDNANGGGLGKGKERGRVLVYTD